MTAPETIPGADGAEVKPVVIHDRIGADLSYWNGRDPAFDASIIMTTYQAAETLEEAISSIFAQDVADGTRVQLIIGVDPSTDGTFELAREITRSPPPWLTIDCFRNTLPRIILRGRQTGRSNFLNCYSRVRGSVVLYLNCDDAWLTRTKLQAQIDHIRRTGSACCTSLETKAPNLKRQNDVAEIKDPFLFGNTILMSSFAMPYIPIRNRTLWWTCPFLDWPLICLCWQRFGIERLLEEKTFYRVSGAGAWSSQDPATKHRLIRFATRQLIVSGPYSLPNRIKLFKYLKTVR